MGFRLLTSIRCTLVCIIVRCKGNTPFYFRHGAVFSILLSFFVYLSHFNNFIFHDTILTKFPSSLLRLTITKFPTRSLFFGAIPASITTPRLRLCNQMPRLLVCLPRERWVLRVTISNTNNSIAPVLRSRFRVLFSTQERDHPQQYTTVHYSTV